MRQIQVYANSYDTSFSHYEINNLNFIYLLHFISPTA